MIIQPYSWCLLLSFLTLARSQGSLIEAGPSTLDVIGTLGCTTKLYTYRVSQADENGRQCWDTLTVLACFGRCNSNEISDWRFPYKKSKHPVCVHHIRNRRVAILKHCEEGALFTAAMYEYMEATSCRCQQCSSSDTSCEGIRYRPHRSDLGFLE